ncbi:hypothetical protein KY343_06905 [Candidatus Woesearchaeota archaeon]|nr:hypothetical protein [Candidatus Woesearchaeota archaeon]
MEEQQGVMGLDHGFIIKMKKTNIQQLKERTDQMFVIFGTGELCQYGQKEEFKEDGKTYIKFILFPDKQLWKYPEYRKYAIVKKFPKKYIKVLKEDIDHARIFCFLTPEGEPTNLIPERREALYKKQILDLQNAINTFTERNSTMKKVLDAEKKKLRLMIAREVDVINEVGRTKKRLDKKSITDIEAELAKLNEDGEQE